MFWTGGKKMIGFTSSLPIDKHSSKGGKPKLPSRSLSEEDKTPTLPPHREVG